MLSEILLVAILIKFREKYRTLKFELKIMSSSNNLKQRANNKMFGIV